MNKIDNTAAFQKRLIVRLLFGFVSDSDSDSVFARLNQNNTNTETKVRSYLSSFFSFTSSRAARAPEHYSFAICIIHSNHTLHILLTVSSAERMTAELGWLVVLRFLRNRC